MAPKKPTALEQPPRTDSSSEYEEEVSNEEEEEEVESEEEEEEEETKKTDPKSDSSSSSEEDEDGSSDEEGLVVAPVKPVEFQSPKMGAKRKQKQPDVAPATAPASTVAKKRPVESKADGKESKKLRKVEDKRVAEEEEEEEAVVVKMVGEDTKKQLIERLFSEEDEVEMLKALQDYSARKCIDPIEDINDFHGFVKPSIHVDVSNAQLADKIRRMRKNYEKNASKIKEGVAKTFGKLHNQLCYDLSKNIWGKAASASGLKAKGKRTLKPNMTSDRKDKPASSLQKEEPVRVRQNTSSLFCLTELAKTTKDVGGMMGLSDDLLKKGFELLNDEARAALEEKWNNIATAELELYHKRLELSGEHVKLSLDALKASGNRG